MPQESFPGTDGKTQYSNTFFALTNSARTQLQEAVLDAYKLSLNPNYTPRQRQGGASHPQQEHHQRQYPEPGYREQFPGQRDRQNFSGEYDDMMPMGLY